MSRFLTKEKISHLKETFQVSRNGFKLALSNGETVEVTHEDISLLYDFAQFRYSTEYQQWLNHYFCSEDTPETSPTN